MRKMIKIWTVLACILVLGAAAWAVRGWYRDRRETERQVAALESVVEALGDGERTHQRNLAKWYNYQLEQGNESIAHAYGTILDLGQGRMAVLAVPGLGIRMPVYHGTGGAVCHDPATPLPIGGRGQHTVLRLSDCYAWTEGLAVYIDCLGQRLTYRVESVQVMGSAWSPNRPTSEGQDLLTLVFDGRNTRTLIRCVRSEGWVLRQEERTKRQWTALSALPLALAFTALRRRKRFASRGQNQRNCGFYRKTAVKTKLF